MTKLRFTWEWDAEHRTCRISGVDMGDGLEAGYDHQAGWYERQLIEEIERLRNDLQELTCGDHRYTQLAQENERLRAGREGADRDKFCECDAPVMGSRSGAACCGRCWKALRAFRGKGGGWSPEAELAARRSSSEQSPENKPTQQRPAISNSELMEQWASLVASKVLTEFELGDSQAADLADIIIASIAELASGDSAGELLRRAIGNDLPEGGRSIRITNRAEVHLDSAGAASARQSGSPEVGSSGECQSKGPNCTPHDCWRRLAETTPIDRPERYISLAGVKLNRATDEALDGLIRRAESCDRVTGYPATHGDLLSALRELRDRRAASSRSRHPARQPGETDHSSETFHPCGPDYTSPDGKWMAPQLIEPINEARRRLGLSEFSSNDYWNMGERNVRLMHYALTGCSLEEAGEFPGYGKPWPPHEGELGCICPLPMGFDASCPVHRASPADRPIRSAEQSPGSWGSVVNIKWRPGSILDNSGAEHPFDVTKASDSIYCEHGYAQGYCQWESCVNHGAENQ